MIDPDFSKANIDLEIDILGKRFKAILIEESPFDKNNERLRS